MTPMTNWGITVRMVFSLVTAFLICLAFVPWLIQHFADRDVGQAIRREGVKAHRSKAGIPTMGGLAIILGVAASTFVWTKQSTLVNIALVSLLFLGFLGFIDDYLKVSKKNSRGLPPRGKLFGQILFSSLLGIYLLNGGDSSYGKIYVPILQPAFDINFAYVGFVIIVIVGCSNAVNLTDGLDGLAAGVVGVVTLCYAGIAYVAGHALGANHLNIPPVPGAGELAIFCAAIVGACIGFLWFNSHPASIFMGDTGSLALGGAIGTVSVLIHQEVLLVIIGGIFVIEAVSVIIQVTSFKLRRKRVFLMSPIHHHFELAGWPESKVVIRFWIITIMFALTGLSLLGLNAVVNG